MKKSKERQYFFDHQVYLNSWKDTMSSKNEEKIISILNNLGYIHSLDYFRQYPVEPFVLDFAFPKIRLCIEIDGTSHNSKIQIKKDYDRDCYLRLNNWIVIRIKDKDMSGEKGSFYKSLIKEVIEDLTNQYNQGKIWEVDFVKYFYE